MRYLYDNEDSLRPLEAVWCHKSLWTWYWWQSRGWRPYWRGRGASLWARPLPQASLPTDKVVSWLVVWCTKWKTALDEVCFCLQSTKKRVVGASLARVLRLLLSLGKPALGTCVSRGSASTALFTTLVIIHVTKRYCQQKFYKWCVFWFKMPFQKIALKQLHPSSEKPIWEEMCFLSLILDETRRFPPVSDEWGNVSGLPTISVRQSF